MRLSLLFFCALLGGAAFAADVFQVMDDQPSPVKHGVITVEPGLLFPNGVKNDGDFLLTALDGRVTLRSTPVLEGVVGEVNMIGTPEDYYTAKFGIYALRPVSGLLVAVSELKSADGDTIPSGHIKLLEVLSAQINNGDGAPGAALLCEPFSRELPQYGLALFQLLIDIPAQTKAGLYRGKISVTTASGEARVLPVALRVMGFRLPEVEQGAGFYLPGHFQIEPKGIFEAFGTPDWRKEHLDRYMAFLKSRRLNSVALYHNYVDLRYVDGKAIADFAELSGFAAAMKKAGLRGPLVIEVRHIAYWCQAVAAKLKSLGGKAPAGDLGIYGWQGWATEHYEPEAIVIFEEVLAQLLETAEREAWPELLIAPEEEMSNTERKAAGYDAFIGSIHKMCPQRAITIDNELGYNRKNEIDRGHRDGIRNRQYNNWPDAALQTAREDGARIMTFNYNPERLSFGLLQYRLGSQLNHQWADYWRFSPRSWQYSKLSSNGVTSTVEMEQIHLGRLDLAACMMQEEQLKVLRSRGDQALADELELLLQQTVADIPANGYVYRNWLGGISDHQLQLRFWKILTAIERALAAQSQTTLPAAHPTVGAPILECREIAQNGTLSPQDDNTRSLLLADQSLQLDGSRDEAFWGAGTGSLIYLDATEKRLRAIWTTEEEFSRLAPSYSAAWFSYAPEGLLIYAEANHQIPGGKYRWERGDDDPDLWQDDVIEFFFRLPEQPDANYQLIVNSKGSKSFNCNLKNVAAKEVRVVTRSPLNDVGGTAWEICIPWHFFQLERAPLDGSVWSCNVGREFHSFDQMLSWVKVKDSFHENQNWGALLFSGKRNNRSFHSLRIPPVYRGMNQISGRGRMEFGSGSICLRNAAGMVVATAPFDGGEAFSLDFPVEAAAELTTWTLESVNAAGDLVDSVRIPILALPTTATIKNSYREAFAGETVEFQVEIRYPQENSKRFLTGALITATGEVIPLPAAELPGVGAQLVRLSTSGLPLGHNRIKLWVDGVGNRQDAESAELTIWPSPWQP